jgi:hypothetical protein
MLVCSEKKVLLTGCWWLVCSERKVLLLVADKPSERAAHRHQYDLEPEKLKPNVL